MLASTSEVHEENQYRMKRIFARFSRRVEILANASSATGLAINFAAAAISSIQSVVEYPSTIPEPGVGSIRPVWANVCEKPKVMAASSHVIAQKRHATKI
jgi:hypothetical protein